jgi:uncharacterized protein DUF5658
MMARVLPPPALMIATRLPFCPTLRMINLVLCVSVITSGLAQAQDAPLAAAQFLDWHSTRTALARPHTQEANVLLQSCVYSNPCFIGVKGLMTAAVIGYVEHARKKHPKSAFWTTLGITAGMTAVAVHNYRQGR